MNTKSFVTGAEVGIKHNPGWGVNFIHESSSEEDIELFLDPSWGEKSIIFDDSWEMADIFIEMGLVKNRAQARKQNMSGPIPSGFTIGREKRKHPHKNFWVLGKMT